MANWDHHSNIGTHPLHDADPDVRRAAGVEAAQRHIDRFTTIRDELTGGPVIPAGSQVTITIGRNVRADHPLAGIQVPERDAQVPMRRAAWHDFRATLATDVGYWVSPVATFGPFIGAGEWEGVAEESSVLILITGEPVTVGKLSAALIALAENFGQEAIAWTHGPNMLAIV